METTEEKLKATIQFLNIGEEQIGEFLSENAAEQRVGMRDKK
jgi:hypothetical protein